MEVHDILKNKREKFGYTQEDLAKRLFVSRQAISKWERGEAIPDIENIIALADLYDISIDNLVRGFNHLEKPFKIGKMSRSMFIVLILFIPLMLIGNTYLYEHSWIFLLILLVGVVVVMEWSNNIATINKTTISYKNRNSIFSFLKLLGNKKYLYSLSEVDSFTLEYIPIRRISPLNLGPDFFSFIFINKDGSEYKYESTHAVIQHLPALCNFLEKQDIKIIDRYNIVDIVIEGKNIFETIHQNI